MPKDKDSRYNLITGQDSYASQTAQDPKTARKLTSFIPLMNGQLLRELGEPKLQSSGVDLNLGHAVMAMFQYDHNNQNGTITRHYFAVDSTFLLWAIDPSGVTPAAQITLPIALSAVPMGVTSPTDGNFHLSDGTNNYLYDGTTWVIEGFLIPQTTPSVSQTVNAAATSLVAYASISATITGYAMPMILSSAQFLIAGLQTANHFFYSLYQSGADSLVSSATGTGTGPDLSGGAIVDADGYIYVLDSGASPVKLNWINTADGSTVAKSILVTNCALTTNGMVNIVDDNSGTTARKYVLVPQNGTAGHRSAVAVKTRAQDSTPDQTAGSSFLLPSSAVVTSGSIVCWITGRNTDGRYYALAKDNAGDFWLTYSDIPTTGNLTAPAEPAGAIKIALSTDSAVPVFAGPANAGGQARDGGVVYDASDDSLILLYSNGTLYKFSAAPATFGTALISAQAPVSSVNLANSADLMFHVGVGTKGMMLSAHNSFFVWYTANGTDASIAEINAGDLKLLTTYNLVTMALPSQFLTATNISGTALDNQQGFLYLTARTGGANYAESASFAVGTPLQINVDRFYWFSFADETAGRTHDSDSSPISGATGTHGTTKDTGALNAPLKMTPTSPNTFVWEYNMPGQGGFTKSSLTQSPGGIPTGTLWRTYNIHPWGNYGGDLDWLIVTGFLNSTSGLLEALPTTAQIKGIQVTARFNHDYGNGSGADNSQYPLVLQLYSNGQAIGDKITMYQVAGKQTSYSGAPAVTWGGPTETWNASLTAAMVNDSNFGCRFSIQPRASNWASTFLRPYITDFEMTVFYSTDSNSVVTVKLMHGQVSTNSSSKTVTGDGSCEFLKSAHRLDKVYVNGSSIGVVDTIQNDNQLTLIANATATTTTQDYVIAPPRATHWHLWASEADGSEVGRYLTSIPIATASYTDSSPWQGEPGSLFLDISRPMRNDPPVPSAILEVHKRRLWRRQDSRLNYLTFSAAEEVAALSNGAPPESNPGVDSLTISDLINADSVPDQSRFIRGMKSHADALYIGTEKNVVPWFGETIDDFGFSQLSAFNVGVAGRWAMCSTNAGLAFVSYDKKVFLYPTANYPWAYVPKDVNVSENLIEIGKPLRNELAKIKSTDLDNVRVCYYNYSIRNWLVLSYQDNTSTYHTWVYDFDTKSWFQLQQGFKSLVVWEVSAGNSVLLGGNADGKIYVIDDQTGTYTGGTIPAAVWRPALIDFGNPDIRHVLLYIDLELTNASLFDDMTVNFYLDPIDVDNPSGARALIFDKVGNSNLYRAFFTRDGLGTVCQRALLEFNFATSSNVGGFRGVHIEAPQAAALLGSPTSILNG